MLQNEPPSLQAMDEQVLASKLPAGYLEQEWKDRQDSLFLLYVVLRKLLDTDSRSETLLHPDLRRWLNGDSVDKSVFARQGTAGVWTKDNGKLNKDECLAWAKAQYCSTIDRRPFHRDRIFAGTSLSSLSISISIYLSIYLSTISPIYLLSLFALLN
jgi:hypothetical protein